MRHRLASTVLFTALLSSGAYAYDNTEAKVVVTPLARTTATAAGQPIALPQGDAEVIVSMFEIPPGASLPVHQHPFPRYAYVLGGTLQVANVETGEKKTYKAGDFIVEMVSLWHQGANIGTEPVKLLVIDQVEQGQPTTIVRE